MLEKDLFPPLKKYFKELGYKVYAEVACGYRGIDFVAVKGNDQIAVEMKTSFNFQVIRQATTNTYSFGKSYVAYPVKKFKIFKEPINEKLAEKYNRCIRQGIGIIQIVQPHDIIFEALEAEYNKPYRLFDFSQYEENENDEAGLPYQKGVSEGYYELKAIKEYVRKNQNATWKEIFNNVQNHYSSPSSMSGSMSQWRGFRLNDYKKILLN